MLNYKPDWSRVSTSTGYKVVYCPEHPRAWSTGYVYVHTIIAEQKLGRLLAKGEVVHHKNEDRMDNSPDNLEVYPSRRAHSTEHTKDAITTMVELKCHECNKTFSRRLGQEPSKKGYKNAFCSRSCSGRSSQRLRAANK